MTADNRPPLVALAGPTASGKTALSVELAKRFCAEVICADSMQIYAGLSIGTARPTDEETEGVPHHLFGFVSPEEAYSVARYADDARRVIDEVSSRGKLPFLCGGTGLYLEAVLDNLQFADEPEDSAVRDRLKAEAAQVGNEVMLEKLRAVDPETAARLHQNDQGRILRALEVFEVTGLTIAEQQRRSRAVPSPYKSKLLVLDYRNRQTLYDRINRRVDLMLKAGLANEAKAFLSAGHAPTAMQAIGYKELLPWLAGEKSLDEAAEDLKQSTRRYAKRQLSWFRRMEQAEFLFVDDYPSPAALADAAAEKLFEFLKQ
ncbi:MAG: tRNA (adenosine(37)-N6)-dimethylallyltransferase MiaA [Clostridia bacterium]|nr:tRNA (adenosine(37)-N6)-dimethylallyltransferase MiaA [Clostridia bacterium]